MPLIHDTLYLLFKVSLHRRFDGKHEVTFFFGLTIKYCFVDICKKFCKKIHIKIFVFADKHMIVVGLKTIATSKLVSVITNETNDLRRGRPSRIITPRLTECLHTWDLERFYLCYIFLGDTFRYLFIGVVFLLRLYHEFFAHKRNDRI